MKNVYFVSVSLNLYTEILIHVQGRYVMCLKFKSSILTNMSLQAHSLRDKVTVMPNKNE